MEELKGVKNLASKLGVKDQASSIDLIVKKAESVLKHKVDAEFLNRDEIAIQNKIDEYSKLPLINAKFLKCESPEDNFHQAKHSEIPFLYQINDFHDIVFSVEGKLINSNRCVLAQRSPFFAILFSSTFQESSKQIIQFPQISHTCMCLILEYIFTDTIPYQQVSKDYEKLFRLLIWADFFQLPHLVDVN